MNANETNNWTQKAKHGQSHSNVGAKQGKEQAVSRNKGNVILDLAEKMRPILLKMFDGVRDDDGILVQPAHIRGIALNMAQYIINKQEQASNA